MGATIDRVRRLLTPKAFRDSLGLVLGEARIAKGESDPRIRPIEDSAVVTDDGWLAVRTAGITVTDDDVRALRDADQP